MFMANEILIIDGNYHFGNNIEVFQLATYIWTKTGSSIKANLG